MASEPPSYEAADGVRAKHVRARNEAVWIVVAGAVVHIVGIVGVLSFSHGWRLAALLMELFGAIAVFAGLIGLYTYYENIEERKYYRDRRVGVGTAMEKS